MTAETYQLVEKVGGVVDLTHRAKFVLSGADRVRYLNGQVTNDVRKATSRAALHACVTNIKGKIESEIFLHADRAGELLFLDAPAEHRETLAARLEKYIIADDVTLTDVTEEWALCHVFGPAAESSTLQFFASAESDHSRVVRCERFGLPGCDIWLKGSALTIGTLEGVPLTPTDAETWRICHGVPAVPSELNADTFPQEAGLERSAMDFAKGCYIGQEILSRIKTTGKMPRKLLRWRLQGAAPEAGVRPGAALARPEDAPEGRSVGEITSACLHPVLDRWVGLAYVRQGVESMHSLLLADEEPPRIFVELEFTPP